MIPDTIRKPTARELQRLTRGYNRCFQEDTGLGGSSSARLHARMLWYVLHGLSWAQAEARLEVENR